jgi:hypothetical protein
MTLKAPARRIAELLFSEQLFTDNVLKHCPRKGSGGHRGRKQG